MPDVFRRLPWSLHGLKSRGISKNQLININEICVCCFHNFTTRSKCSTNIAQMLLALVLIVTSHSICNVVKVILIITSLKTFSFYHQGLVITPPMHQSILYWVHDYLTGFNPLILTPILLVLFSHPPLSNTTLLLASPFTTHFKLQHQGCGILQYQI